VAAERLLLTWNCAALSKVIRDKNRFAGHSRHGSWWHLLPDYNWGLGKICRGLSFSAGTVAFRPGQVADIAGVTLRDELLLARFDAAIPPRIWPSIHR